MRPPVAIISIICERCSSVRCTSTQLVRHSCCRIRERWWASSSSPRRRFRRICRERLAERLDAIAGESLLGRLRQQTLPSVLACLQALDQVLLLRHHSAECGAVARGDRFAFVREYAQQIGLHGREVAQQAGNVCFERIGRFHRESRIVVHRISAVVESEVDRGTRWRRRLGLRPEQPAGGTAG